MLMPFRIYNNFFPFEVRGEIAFLFGRKADQKEDHKESSFWDLIKNCNTILSWIFMRREQFSWKTEIFILFHANLCFGIQMDFILFPLFVKQQFNNFIWFCKVSREVMRVKWTMCSASITNEFFDGKHPEEGQKPVKSLMKVSDCVSLTQFQSFLHKKDWKGAQKNHFHIKFPVMLAILTNEDNHKNTLKLISKKKRRTKFFRF